MTDASYFDRLYADSHDPWDLSSSGYEQHKLDLLMSSLPRPRYRNAFEPGCAIGVTTLALAGRCDRVLGMDCAAAAIEQASARVADYGHVTVVHGRIPEDWPDDSFDLIVLSEVLYYLDDEARSRVADRVVASLVPDGELVAVHWRHPFVEAATTGDQAHAELTERLGRVGLTASTNHLEDDFRLDVFSRRRLHVGPKPPTPA